MIAGEYARPKWYVWNRAARLRRKQLALSLEKLKQPAPYARFLYASAWLWLFLNFAFFFFNWVFDIFLSGFLWFVAYMALSSFWIGSTFLYALIQKYWPGTVKVQVGGSPDMSAKEFVPGKNLDTIELPTSGAPNPAIEKIPVELILHGGVDNLPVPRKRDKVTIARCTVRDPRSGRLVAGHLKGSRYYIPCKPKPYIGGDAHNWRGFDYLGLARHHFGDVVTAKTILVVALDEDDPMAWESTPESPSLQKELFESKQRILSLENKLTDYHQRDEDRRSFGRSENEP